ncbi:MAG: BatD family protein [Candidatus Cloacimonetes bacterium]|nr:BatD family protein [Candidatus Cloacimonadota bacterium]
MKKLLLLILFFNTFLLLAQEIEIDSYVDKNKIGISDMLTFTIEISGENVPNISAPVLPEFNDFENLGTSSSSSSNYSIINGKMSSKITRNYSYTLRPVGTGNYLIPPITLEIQNKKFTTDPIHIQVVEGSTEPAPPASSNFRSRTDQSSDIADNLFLRVEISKKNVYLSEPIIVDYKLYSRDDIANLAFAGDTNFEGFWKEDVFTPESINFKQETYRDVRYNVMLMRSVALFPTQTGQLEIPSLSLNVDIREKSRNFFDFGSTRRYSIQNDPETIQVKPIPTENRPADYVNAVGSFQLTSGISETNLKVGDSFTLTIIITGNGNLKQFDVPKLPKVTNLRFLDPEISTEINKNVISGKKTIKYLIIAQEKGNYILPAITFTYFDTDKHSFKTLRTNPIDLAVREGNLPFISSSNAQSIVNEEGADIGFVITNKQIRSQKLYFNSFVYWLIWFIIFLFIPGSYLYSQERDKLKTNADYVRQKQAAKVLKKYMKQASLLVNKNEPGFYTTVQQGLGNYLADKLKEPRGSTTDKIILALTAKQVPPMLLKNVQTIFETCDQARFMPGGFSQEKIKLDFKLVNDTIKEIIKCKL